MAKGYTLQMDALTEEAFRKARASYIENTYKKRIEADTTTSRSEIILQIAREIGVRQRCIRQVLYNAGLPTALPNYVRCGNRTVNREQSTINS